MNKKIPYILYTILTVSLGFHANVYAQGDDNPPPAAQGQGSNAGAANEPNAPGASPGTSGGQHHMFKEAIDACSGKAAGDACSFTGRMNNNIDGNCRMPPKGKGQLVCLPKPPQEAFDACNGKAEGDACAFTGRMNNTRNGTCKKAPMGEGHLICRPERPPVPAGSQQGNNPPASK